MKALYPSNTRDMHKHQCMTVIGLVVNMTMSGRFLVNVSKFGLFRLSGKQRGNSDIGQTTAAFIEFGRALCCRTVSIESSAFYTSVTLSSSHFSFCQKSKLLKSSLRYFWKCLFVWLQRWALELYFFTKVNRHKIEPGFIVMHRSDLFRVHLIRNWNTLIMVIQLV